MNAEDFAKQQRSISISEFFEKNRHLLGFDNKVKALLMIIKEGVDNSLDATEDAGFLPEIYIKLRELKPEIYEIVIKDNGPGVVKKQIPKIFGKLLYGSKFHKLKQSRGQQGIGISAATLYSQLTTGEPLQIVSSTGNGIVHRYKIKIDVRKNEPIIIENGTEEGIEWRGTQLKFITEGLYREGRQSIPEYIKQTAISNPHANIVFDSPKGRLEFKRVIDHLPKDAKEIQPHIQGVELGVLLRMLRETKARTLSKFFTSEFTKIGRKSAKDICELAGLSETAKPKKITDEEGRKIIGVVKKVKLMKPPTDCLSPLGSDVTKEGMKKELEPEWVESITRAPEVYRGWPFQIEVGIAYGGKIESPKVMRFANRVPLLYQAGDCAVTKSVSSIEWKRYGLTGKGIPEDPVAIFVHMVSVWVPFTSESKESIASYPIIMKEIKLAVQECARKLGLYLSGKRKLEYHKHRMSTFEKYSGETASAISELTNVSKEKIENIFRELIESKREHNQEEEENGGGKTEEAGTQGSEPSSEEGESYGGAPRQVTLERVLRREVRPDSDGK